MESNMIQQTNTMADAAVDPKFALVLGSFFFIFLLIGLVSYILSSIALTKMARNDGIKRPWLAWIPFGNVWIMGELVSYKLKGNGGLKYLLATLIYVVLSLFHNPIITIISVIAYLVISIMVLYWLFFKFSNKPVLHTVLSLLIPFYKPIVFFVVRNTEPKQLESLE